VRGDRRLIAELRDRVGGRGSGEGEQRDEDEQAHTA
jgi:hypothetical protein